MSTNQNIAKPDEKQAQYLIEIAKSLRLDNAINDDMKYAKRALAIMKSVLSEYKFDYRGLCYGDCEKDCVTLTDNLMLGIFSKAVGKADVQDRVYEACKDKENVLIFSELTRTMFEIMSGKEIKKGVHQRGDPDEQLMLFRTIRDAVVLGKTPITENLDAEESETNSGILALTGVVWLLHGNKEKALAVLEKIDSSEYKDEKTGLYLARTLSDACEMRKEEDDEGSDEDLISSIKRAVPSILAGRAAKISIKVQAPPKTKEELEKMAKEDAINSRTYSGYSRLFCSCAVGLLLSCMAGADLKGTDLVGKFDI
jgi:hypothetical protein